MSRAEVYWINGPVLKARTDGVFQMKEAVFVGDTRLAAEVIRLDEDTVTVQVFEDTTGLKPGVSIEGSGLPLAVDLGPGMLGAMFDGIQRPLVEISRRYGDFFGAGLDIAALDAERAWPFVPETKSGGDVLAGAMLGTVPETQDLATRVMVPPGLRGRLEWIAPEGEYRIDEVVARVTK